MISIDKAGDTSKASTADARRELVNRITRSATFAKSERLSSILTFVCDLTLRGQANEINEQKIGMAVFNRSRDYDSSTDGIVRTQASRLRQRLDLYFKSEGADEPIHIVISRGSYVPVFEPRPLTEITPPAPIASSEIPPERCTEVEAQHSRNAIFSWILVELLAIVILIMSLIYRGAFTNAQSTGAQYHPLWSQMFVPDQRTLVIPGDSSLVLWKSVADRNMDLAGYLSGDYRKAVDGAATPAQREAAYLANARYTSIVDLDITQSLSQIAQSRKSPLEVRYARDARPNDLKRGNAILIGASEANPLGSIVRARHEFRLFR